MYTEVGLLTLGLHLEEGKNTNKEKKKGEICEETWISLTDPFELKTSFHEKQCGRTANTPGKVRI